MPLSGVMASDTTVSAYSFRGALSTAAEGEEAAIFGLSARRDFIEGRFKANLAPVDGGVQTVCRERPLAARWRSVCQ